MISCQVKATVGNSETAGRICWVSCQLMLCRGSEVLREVAWVIFDEVGAVKPDSKGGEKDSGTHPVPAEAKHTCAVHALHGHREAGLHAVSAAGA